MVICQRLQKIICQFILSYSKFVIKPGHPSSRPCVLVLRGFQGIIGDLLAHRDTNTSVVAFCNTTSYPFIYRFIYLSTHVSNLLSTSQWSKVRGQTAFHIWIRALLEATFFDMRISEYVSSFRLSVDSSITTSETTAAQI